MLFIYLDQPIINLLSRINAFFQSFDLLFYLDLSFDLFLIALYFLPLQSPINWRNETNSYCNEKMLADFRHLSSLLPRSCRKFRVKIIIIFCRPKQMYCKCSKKALPLSKIDWNNFITEIWNFLGHVLKSCFELLIVKVVSFDLPTNLFWRIERAQNPNKFRY